jgi:hypothetical protein
MIKSCGNIKHMLSDLFCCVQPDKVVTKKKLTKAEAKTQKEFLL